MKQIVIALLALLLPALAHASDRPSAETEQAVVAWLHLVDEGQYETSWTNASPEFQKRVMQTQWVGAVGGVRKPLGAVSSRKLDKVLGLKSLPGLPDGNYTVMQFQTTFANKESAVETVTLIPDGETLKVAGYFVK